MASSVFMLNAGASLGTPRFRFPRRKTMTRQTPSKTAVRADEPHPRHDTAEPVTSHALSPPAPPTRHNAPHYSSAENIHEPEPQWHAELNAKGSKEFVIAGLVVSLAMFEYVGPEHAMLKPLLGVVHCIIIAIAFYCPPTRPRGESSLHSSIVTCEDPTNCCLHKTSEAFPGKKPNSAPKASSTLRSQSSASSVKGFPLGFSMARSQMNATGNTSEVPHSCAKTRAETFQIRSQGYKKSKKKEASKAALFEFIGADLLRTDSKTDLISERLELPKEFANDKVFIINAQLPSYAPSLWGDAACDGPGFTLALCWRIPPEVCVELKDPKSKELRLLKRFLEEGADTSLTDRFKVIAQVTNQDLCGVTGMAKKLLGSHNATPVLTRPQHHIHHFNEGSTEVVVDIHAFSYIARRGIHMLLDKCTDLVVDVAFVLQGETENELPERILGCCRLDRVDISKAVELPR